MTERVEVDTLAFMKVDNRVILWANTDSGWAAFYQAASFSREQLAEAVRKMPTTYDLQDVMVVPIEKTSLPDAIPQLKLAGCHPLLLLEDDNPPPVWDGPTTREEEEAAR